MACAPGSLTLAEARLVLRPRSAPHDLGAASHELLDAFRAGAGRYERTDERVTDRNGTRPRLVATQAGDIELRIPKLRKGSFFPAILEPRRRIDQALYAVVMEAYAHGVSTRSVDHLVGAMGVESGISKSEVSRICAGLDEIVGAFRTRRLDRGGVSRAGSRFVIRSCPAAAAGHPSVCPCAPAPLHKADRRDSSAWVATNGGSGSPHRRYSGRTRAAANRESPRATRGRRRESMFVHLFRSRLGR